MGRLDVDKLMSEMPPNLIGEWMAFERHFPTPIEREFASLKAFLANLWGDGSRDYSPVEFLPVSMRIMVMGEDEQSQDEMNQAMSMIRPGA